MFSNFLESRNNVFLLLSFPESTDVCVCVMLHYIYEILRGGIQIKGIQQYFPLALFYATQSGSKFVVHEILT